MKNLIFAVLLLASFSANAGYFSAKNYDISPFWGGAAKCVENYTCTGSVNQYDGGFYPDGSLFEKRDASVVIDYITSTETLNATLSWQSSNVLPGNLYLFILGTEESGKFSVPLSGVMQFLFEAGKEYSIGISAKTPNADTSALFTLTGEPIDSPPDTIETPLPATAWLFLSILPLFAFRRRPNNKRL